MRAQTIITLENQSTIAHKKIDHKITIDNIDLSEGDYSDLTDLQYYFKRLRSDYTARQ